MTESKSEFRQFVRYVTASMTDQELLVMVSRFWPRGKFNLTEAVLDTLVKKCMPYIFSPKNEAALRSHIRKIWPKRGNILDATLLKELNAKRTLFSEKDEQVLQDIYDNFPRREKSLTSVVVDSIPGYSSELVRDVWKRRLYARNGRERYREFKNRPRLTPEESELLTTIYLNWPANEKRFSPSNQGQIAKDIGVSNERVSAAWELKQWYPRAPNISYWKNRLVAAIVANNIFLFDYYVERDNVNGLVNEQYQGRGGTPLMEAIRCRHHDMFDVLMEMGADVNSVRHNEYPRRPSTALVNACYVATEEINEYVGRLLAAGANPTVCAGVSNMPPLWYYLERVVEPTLVEGLMPGVEALNRQTKDRHWTEACETILMLACRQHPTIVPMLLTVPGLNVHQKTNYGNTALHFAAEKCRKNIIQQLLAVPDIEKNAENKHSKTPLDIAYCHCDTATIEMMKNAGCHRNRANEVCRLHANGLSAMLRVVGPQISGETTRSSSPDRSSPMIEPQNCIKFHLNQGNVGICYLVAVIALFQNEFTILHKLAECVDDEEDNRLLRKELQESDIPEVDPTIKSLVSFLSKDYSGVDFTRECPVLPATWRKTVHQTDQMSRADIINGGSAAFLITFIFKTLDTWHDAFNVYFDQHVISNVTCQIQDRPDRYEVWHATETIFKKKLQIFENNKEKNIALIELGIQGMAQSQMRVDLYNPFERVDKMARNPNVRGFLVRVSDSDERGHVFAGTVCDEFSGQKVLYCNSWGNGCVDWRHINQELCDKNPTYKITTIHFVLRK